MAVTQTEDLVDVSVAAQRLGLSHWTLRAWAGKGRIGSHKLGRRLLFSPSELDRIVREGERPRTVTVKAA